MENLVKRLNQNKVFKFLSSVKLAVPTMLILIVVVAIGTIIESRYNAQVSGILVYKSKWFLALLGILWVNIFCSTISRIPYKEHHTGFVVVHIGLLTLLIGSMVTFIWGIDGSLRIIEGQSGNKVALNELVLKVISSDGQFRYNKSIPRVLDPTNGNSIGLSDLKDKSGLIVEKIEPFVSFDTGFIEAPESTQSDQVGPYVGFKLESAFFNVNEWLQTKLKPENQMGPAKLRLIVAKKNDSPKKKVSTPKAVVAEEALLIKNAQTGAVISKLKVSQFKNKETSIQGIKIKIAEVLEEASVANGKLIDQGRKGVNPALVLVLNNGKENAREVVFAKFATFALHPNGVYGLKFEYLNTNVQSADSAEEHTHTAQVSTDRNGNVIEFHYDPANPTKVKVELYKNDKSVLNQIASVGDVIQTPWMGQKITITDLKSRALPVDNIQPTTMIPKSPLPPSAIFVRAIDSNPQDGVWVIENDFKTIQTKYGNYDIFYGMNSVDLPFSLKLEKFEKIDYPGTETPMSFQSTVLVNGTGVPTIIKMNEPLIKDGYVLYQASYEMAPGSPTASIFSVNQDPGRITKYVGAVVLCLGIVLFTLMRSEWYREFKRKKANQTKGQATS